MKHNNTLQVEAIKYGTVIDHIPAQIGFKILLYFHLTETNKRITIGLNLPSVKMGRKDLIKIENNFLTDNQINQLTVYAMQATVNLIEEYKIVSKIIPTIPNSFESFLTCPNSSCISRTESLFSNFDAKKRNGEVYLKCKYCEKEFTRHVIISQ